MARGKQGYFAKILQEEFINYLEEKAQLLTLKAVMESDFRGRTGNLYDSYGYAIFLNGSLKRSSILSEINTARLAQTPKKWYKDIKFGTEVAQMTFEKQQRNGNAVSGGYAPSDKRGYVVVIAATMPYAVVLEQGGYQDGRVQYKKKYHVITQIVSDCEDIGKDLCGKSLVSHVDLKNWQVFDKENGYK